MLSQLILVAFLSSAASELSPELPSSMKDHRYVFLSGAHHSGTTLSTLILCSHPDAACLRDTKRPEDEGCHVQPQIYKTEHQMGPMKYAYHPDGHLTEESPLLTDANRLRIFESWAPFWNLSKPVLVEKSPRHTIMTRFLQAAFTRDASRFLVILRHPLAASAYMWFRNRKTEEAVATCGRPWIEHWLQIYRWIKDDAPFLRQIAVFQYERMLAGSLKLSDSRMLTQGWIDALFTFMDLPTGLVKAEYAKAAQAGEEVMEGRYAKLELDESGGARRRRLLQTDPQTASLSHDEEAVLHTANASRTSGSRRKLLEFYGGSRYQVKINDRLVYKWVGQWKEIVDMTSPVCQDLIHEHEEELNSFGYSLRDLTYAAPPPAFAKYLLKLGTRN
eukprot:TRINITY_DN29_c0_g1_i1.p1 TRINITY_DN29_c0_g1~~TRINITY_DN29_c0_g1_i1.p1  ORF type:complete len:389 (+),score=76.50 TRINITY_DN29_c0_g1_i1:238-1404(+)